MRFARLIILILSPLLIDMIGSCSRECGPAPVAEYTHKTLVASSLDNTGTEPVVTANDTIVKTGYGIRITILREAIAHTQPPVGFFIQSAYAMSCCKRGPNMVPQDSITAIRIYTINDFDSTHAAASEVTGYFKAYKNYYYTSVTEYVQTLRNSFSSDEGFVLTTDLLLMNPPVASTSHQFRIVIELSDGRTLEQLTSTLELI